MASQSKYLVVFLILIFFSCQEKPSEEDVSDWKSEILQTETDFSNLAKTEGMNMAFLKYVANGAVLLRNDKLIKGSDSIQNYLKDKNSKGLSWKPDFVDVSKSGDLGYTYGKYTFEYQDSIGNKKLSEGIFHTVWKRQPDNSWKFVWD